MFIGPVEATIIGIGGFAALSGVVHGIDALELGQRRRGTWLLCLSGVMIALLVAWVFSRIP